MTDRTSEKELANAIYRAWMNDERWTRMDLAIVAKGNPMAYFWAEIAARAVLDALGEESVVTKEK